MAEAEEYQLKIEDIHLSFGGLNALSGVSTGVKRGEIFSSIGPNGAGKTCLLNCINSFYQPDRGKVIFEGRDITDLKAHRIATLGIARTFQNVELFAHMTVLDNIKLGGHIHLKSGVFSGGIYFGKARREEMTFRKHIEEKIIDLLEIEHLAMRPRILLLDEPCAGMNLEETEDIARFVLDIKEEWDVTIILIEHDMGVVMDISDRVCVLDFGKKIAEGLPANIRHNEHVIKAYLGEEDKTYSRLDA
jgi:branched-chain amino acid transport system ATP-binding protein